MKIVIDVESWNNFYKSVANKPLPCDDEKEAQAYVLGLKDASNVINTWIVQQPYAEEKRGRWEKIYIEGTGYFNLCCSVCGELCLEDSYYGFFDEECKYCPNCGAKMDLGEEE